MSYFVLLSAPIATLIERVTQRTNNPYGKAVEQQVETAHYLDTVEPKLRHGATLELDGRRPVGELADVCRNSRLGCSRSTMVMNTSAPQAVPRHADARTTMRPARARKNLDVHAMPARKHYLDLLPLSDSRTHSTAAWC